jgi:hypothetical protein
MGLLRLFLEFDVLVTLFLLEELVVPYMRDRRLCPVSRWVLGKLRSKAARIASKTPTEELLDSALTRQREAQARLDAASCDLEAAAMERRAAELEARTNKMRSEEEGDPS